MRLRALPLFAVALVTTGTAAAAHAAPAGTTADCLADTRIVVPRYEPATNGVFYDDPLAVSPNRSWYGIMAAPVGPCLDGQEKVTVSRPDGTGAHQVTLDQRYEGPAGLHHYAYDHLAYATATGAWRITKIEDGGQSATLTHPVSFTIKRASTLTFSASVNVPSKPRATGTVTYWTAGGTQAPAPGRQVYIDTWIDGNPRLVARTTTDRNGRYSVALPVYNGAYVRASVPSTPTVGWVVSKQIQAWQLHPTVITGTAAPTSDPVIHSGTKMSTYGHLRVLNSAGTSIPYAGRQVVVQTRPKANPSAGYSTVATATTSSTGYYYANWNASVDADVRVAFISPYKTVTSSFRWVRGIDVQ